jgi:hypothetical protein
MNRIVMVTAVVVLVFCSVRDTEACSCVVPERTPAQERQDVADQLERAVAVFTGTVTRIDWLTAQFDADLVWKGELGERVVMALHDGPRPDGTLAFSSCDYVFQMGRSYLVFAQRDRAGRMRAYYCTRTAELKQAQPTLQVLEAIVTPRRIEPSDGNTPRAAACVKLLLCAVAAGSLDHAVSVGDVVVSTATSRASGIGTTVALGVRGTAGLLHGAR